MKTDDQGSPAADDAAETVTDLSPEAYAARMAAVRAAFLDLWQSDYDSVVRFLMRSGARAEAAQDAAQDAFVDAWSLVTRPGEWEKIDNPRAWIRTVALRKYRRPPGPRRRPPTVLVPEVPDREWTDHAELTTTTMFVLTELRSLDEDTRTVMSFHMDGFTSVEISRQLGMTDQKVRDLIKKGRKILARRLASLRWQGDGMEMETR